MLPSGGLDGAKYMKNSRVFFFFLIHLLFHLGTRSHQNSFYEDSHPKQSRLRKNSNADMERLKAQKDKHKINSTTNTSPYKR
jgi:hypothetical protein